MSTFDDLLDQKLGRRSFLLAAGVATLTLTGCARIRERREKRRFASTARSRVRVPQESSSFVSDYGALPNERFPIAALNPSQLAPRFRRQMVRYRTKEKPGTVIVDTRSFYLYHVRPGGEAMRYGVGLGRQGFAWSGRAKIQWKRPWPTWTPPEEMIERQPELEKYSAENGGMQPGIDNPLGSRALYIFQDGEDTLYRLHGTPEVSSIGKAVSSGCVRLVNQDVIHLYDNVRSGSTIVVR